MKHTIFAIAFFLIAAKSDSQSFYNEKISLSIDRDIYITGENIWYSAYITDNAGNYDSVLSSVMYFELYDQQFNSIARTKNRVINGAASGYVVIPKEISTGNYLFRTYTQYTRNFDPIIQNTVLVTIVNPQLPAPKNELLPDEDIYIAAEGGVLLPGVPSRVAIRLPPGSRSPYSKITVVNDKGELVTEVQDPANGLSMFEIEPQSDCTYELVAEKTDGVSVRKPMPVSDTGVILRVDPAAGGLKIRLFQSGKAPVKEAFTISLFTKSFENIYNGVYSSGDEHFIALNGIEPGMLFCMLKHGNKVIDMRPVFSFGKMIHELTARTDKSIFAPREDVKVDIQLPAGFNGRVLVSAVNSDAKTFSERDRSSYQIPWYAAYNPVLFHEIADRFTVFDDSLLMQINTLMILYSDLFKKSGSTEYPQNPVHEFLPEVSDAGISGILINRRSRTPISEVLVYCSVLDESNQLHLYKTDKNGRFHFTLNHLSGSPHNVFISPACSDSVDILINSDFDVRYPQAAGIIPFIMDTSCKRLLNNLYRNSQLNSIFLRHGEKKGESKLYHPLQKPDRVHKIRLTDYVEMPVMQEVFSEIVPFVAIKQKNDDYHLQLFDERLNSTLDDPLTLVDGIPVFDLDQILAISPEVVKEIALTNRMIHLGEYTMNGIVDIATNTDNFGGIRLPSSSRFIEFHGVDEEFYPLFPRHHADITDPFPDFRTLLYWNPRVKGNQVIFSAGDDTGEYLVTVCASDGENTYRGNCIFKVGR